MSAPLSPSNLETAKLLADKKGNYGKVIVQDPLAKGPAPGERDASGKLIAKKGGKRKTLKRKTRKALKRKRYSRRR